MNEDRGCSRLFRFAAFEVDVAAGELRKSGLKIRLQEQPFRVLALLLERPGELITREEMRQRLWPTDTWVDFDRSFNTSISKIRQALGDSAHHPRFIETVPRRGYRFIGSAEGKEPEPSPKRAWVWVAAAAFLILVATGGWFGLRGPAAPAPELPNPVPLTTYRGQEESPSFSPDGNEVAFSWNGEDGSNFDIYRKLVGPGEPVRLTKDPAREIWPAWSPDGRSIAFLREMDAGRAGVFLIPSSGGTAERLVEKDANLLNRERLAWSPGGKWLLFSDTAADEVPHSLFMLSVATGKKRRITSPPATLRLGDREASFSPDGRSVVFVHEGTDLCTLALSEDLTPQGEPKCLSLEPGGKHDPLWTPDGREIIYSVGRARRARRVELSGPAESRPLASIGADAAHLTISNQGHRLAYSQLASDSDIWRIPGLEGPSVPPERFISSTRRDGFARWSPDGRRIAFSSERSGTPEIWVCDRNGENEVKVTSFDGPHVGPAEWCPDSRLLAFDCWAPGQRDIYVVSADGGSARRVTTDPADDAVPSWSRDGRWIYFASNRSGNSQVWKIPANGGEAKRVTSRGGRWAYESADRDFVYYTKGQGRPTSLWKVPVEGGEESLVLKSVKGNCFAVADEGIYFNEGDGRSIQFLSFVTGKSKLIAAFEKRFASLGVSSDRRWILYDPMESGADLMLVENFW